MDAGDLYYLARKLKGLTEASLGAKPGDIEAIPLPQRLIIGYVLHSPGATIQELSTNLSLAQSVVSTSVGALRERGLLVTQTDRLDRRRVKVLPSKLLRSWARRRLHQDLEGVLAPLLQELSRKDQECVLRALALLNETFKQREEEGRIKGLVSYEGGSR